MHGLSHPDPPEPPARARSRRGVRSAEILRTDLAGLELANPLMLAAGTAGTLDEMGEVLDLGRVGAVVTKSITPEGREGNETWRIVESRVGMLNAIGLANVGLERFLEHYAPRIASLPTRVVASAAGFRIEDYVRSCAALDEIESLGGIELNVSCPNVEHGAEFGSDPALLAELVAGVRPVVRRARLFAKLSPVTSTPPGIVALARAAVEPSGACARGGPNARAGVDALVISNTIPAMSIDVRRRVPRLANVTGGLSGPALHPIVCKLIHDVWVAVGRETRTPIIGCGGVMRWEDAGAFILAGATGVQLGTALFADPLAPVRIARSLRAWARREGVESIGELVGALRAGEG